MKPEKEATLGQVLKKLKVSVPLLKASSLDPSIRDLLLHALLLECLESGSSVALPDGLNVEYVPLGQARAEREILAGARFNEQEKVRS